MLNALRNVYNKARCVGVKMVCVFC